MEKKFFHLSIQTYKKNIGVIVEASQMKKILFLATLVGCISFFDFFQTCIVIPLFFERESFKKRWNSMDILIAILCIVSVVVFS